MNITEFISKVVKVKAVCISSDEVMNECLDASMTFNGKPKKGDYCIFLKKDDVYHCPKDVFEMKYEAK